MVKQNKININFGEIKTKIQRGIRSFLFKVVLGVCVALAVGWFLKYPKSIFVNAESYKIMTNPGFGFVRGVVDKLNEELQEDCGYPKWLRNLLGKHCVSLIFPDQNLENMVVCQEFNVRRKDPEEALDVFVLQFADCIVVDKSNSAVWEIKEKKGGSIIKRPRTKDTNYNFCKCDPSSIEKALKVLQRIDNEK